MDNFIEEPNDSNTIESTHKCNGPWMAATKEDIQNDVVDVLDWMRKERNHKLSMDIATEALKKFRKRSHEVVGTTFYIERELKTIIQNAAKKVLNR